MDLNEFQTNLVPFPRLHFMITAMAPITTQDKKETTNNEFRPITEQCFSAQNFFAKIADFDAEEDKYMAVNLNYRGQVKAKEANATLQWLKTNQDVTFMEWVSTGFKVGLNEIPAARDGDHDKAALFDRNVVMIGNNTAISRVFIERITKSTTSCTRSASSCTGTSERARRRARSQRRARTWDYLDVLSEQITDGDAL